MFNGSKIKLTVSAGLTVVGIGIAAFVAVPAYAAPTTANAVVTPVLTLSGLSAAFTLSGAPATTATVASAVTMNAKSNNTTGYNVTVQAATATMTGVNPKNADTIPASALTVRNTATAGAYTPISSAAAVTVANKATKSAAAGDTVNNDYQMVIPWVNSDTYQVTLNYILANNP